MIKSILLFCLFAAPAFADLPGAPSSINPMQPGQGPPQPSAKPPPQKKETPFRMPKVIIPPHEKIFTAPKGDFYSYPGVVGARDNLWEGSDNFVNMSKSIAVQVNLVQPKDLVLSIKKEDIKSKILEIFGKSSIKYTDSGEGNKPPLPFFNMLIMIYPIQEGYAAACQGRLFESVELKRIVLDPNTVFQAITWEQINLTVAPSEELDKLLMDSVSGIADNFVKKLAAYENPPKENSRSEAP